MFYTENTISGIVNVCRCLKTFHFLLPWPPNCSQLTIGTISLLSFNWMAIYIGRATQMFRCIKDLIYPIFINKLPFIQFSTNLLQI